LDTPSIVGHEIGGLYSFLTAVIHHLPMSSMLFASCQVALGLAISSITLDGEKEGNEAGRGAMWRHAGGLKFMSPSNNIKGSQVLHFH